MFDESVIKALMILTPMVAFGITWYVIHKDNKKNKSLPPSETAYGFTRTRTEGPVIGTMNDQDNISLDA